MFKTVLLISAVGEIMLKNTVEPERPQMRVACWIRKATGAHAFPRQQWFSERASMLHYCLHVSEFFAASIFRVGNLKVKAESLS
jgi:hypothetical protein